MLSSRQVLMGLMGWGYVHRGSTGEEGAAVQPHQHIPDGLQEVAQVQHLQYHTAGTVSLSASRANLQDIHQAACYHAWPQ